jgi:hypothetical protein
MQIGLIAHTMGHCLRGPHRDREETGHGTAECTEMPIDSFICPRGKMAVEVQSHRWRSPQKCESFRRMDAAEVVLDVFGLTGKCKRSRVKRSEVVPEDTRT